jgi:hypothetical protein
MEGWWYSRILNGTYRYDVEVSSKERHFEDLSLPIILRMPDMPLGANPKLPPWSP